MKYILGGHWTTPPEGWTVLTEQEQDMTKRLQWDDNSVDAIFSEHAAMEHLSFIDGVGFLKEAYRVIKPGGVIRIVCPMLEILCDFKDNKNDTLTRNYIKTSIEPYYSDEFDLLISMGIDPYINGKQFIMDSLLKKHNHKMIWSRNLLVKVFSQIGFEVTSSMCPGESSFMSAEECPERKIRGINTGKLPFDATDIPEVYDPESLVIEAIK